LEKQKYLQQLILDFKGQNENCGCKTIA
jgi:hypothetical protein